MSFNPLLYWRHKPRLAVILSISFNSDLAKMADLRYFSIKNSEFNHYSGKPTILWRLNSPGLFGRCSVPGF